MGRRFILDDLAKVKQTKQDYLSRGDYGGLEEWQSEKTRQLAIRYQVISLPKRHYILLS